MSKSVEQLFVNSTDHQAIEDLLKDYVKRHANRFEQCSTILLEGVEQVLKCLIKSKREYLLLAQKDWTVIWEKVDYSTFADPAVARFLSDQLSTEAIYMKFDENYNIFAHQVFKNGKSIKESFLPKSYFQGDFESPTRMKYGSCWKAADKFNARRSLPLFLESLAEINRKPALVKKIQRVVCKFSLAKQTPKTK